MKNTAEVYSSMGNKRTNRLFEKSSGRPTAEKAADGQVNGAAAMADDSSCGPVPAALPFSAAKSGTSPGRSWRTEVRIKE